MLKLNLNMLICMYDLLNSMIYNLCLKQIFSLFLFFFYTSIAIETLFIFTQLLFCKYRKYVWFSENTRSTIAECCGNFSISFNHSLLQLTLTFPICFEYWTLAEKLIVCWIMVWIIISLFIYKRKSVYSYLFFQRDNKYKSFINITRNT